MFHSRAFRLLFLLLVVWPQAAAAQPTEVRFAWDASTAPGVAGYVIHYGTAPGVHPNSVTVGLRTEYPLRDLKTGTTYYFVVRAYDGAGRVGPPSTEIVHTTATQLTVPSAAKTELIWRHSETGDIARWQMEGLQQSTGSLLGSSPVHTDWKIVGAGDFNGDRQRDLVWQHSTGWLSVWLMNGVTLLRGLDLQPNRVPDTNWRVAAVADMDNDGKPDLVWQHHGNGDAAVWLMNGTSRRDGRLLSPNRVSDLNWKIVGAGDFNGDKWNDLLWRHKTTGQLAVWHMSGERQLSGQPLVPAVVEELEWNVASVADVNGDSRADIIWQHADGRLGAWVMDSLKMAWVTTFTPAMVSDRRWQIVAAR
ncbi:MAG TPA: FG-GAP-like repeat-containing protein [Gemmatimonadaceae bacterium]|nr:FG-GAP-like repeat-containing protein [Gemmatimonadaceae bacterium]